MYEANKQLAERFHMDIFVAGKLHVADQIVTPDFVAHPPVPNDFCHGPGGVRNWATAIRAALPDLSITHSHVIAEGDLVAIRWESSGTHTGEMLGIPASGRSVRTSGFDLFRIAGGRIAEMWQDWDALGFMQQTGALSPAQPVTAEPVLPR